MDLAILTLAKKYVQETAAGVEAKQAADRAIESKRTIRYLVENGIPCVAEIAGTRPEASEQIRGRLIGVQDGNTDRLYICIRVNGQYGWMEIGDVFEQSTTAILGKAILGKNDFEIMEGRVWLL